jgi:[glutamine synthetase] adenylyltransferase / [glutamine synthetase]-adenylyl-L-tyrosine phosphorylase
MKRTIVIDPDELTGLSRFVDEAWRRFPDASGRPDAVEPPDQSALDDDPELALRRYRQLTSVHILWQDLSGQASIGETGQALSQLARDCLELALGAAERRVEANHGRLLDADDQPIRLTILGLGKLGGDELNFNSDIDLVFAYQGSGQSDGRRRLDAAAYLKKVALELIRLLDTVTAQGRVWIVDTRLRPFGDSGALVWSVGAMEQYFVNEGRTWERYAWLKAGPVAGDPQASQILLDSLEPFVFRRYLDYGIFDSLRELHQQIDANSRARSRKDDIKRGAGGIRELEFLVQSQQILRGGRDRQLRARGFLPALNACAELGLMAGDQAERLSEAYQFLRILENRLQAMTGRQGHHLPEQDADRERLARLMGNSHWSELSEEIRSYRQTVRDQFRSSFSEPEPRTVTTPGLWPPDERLAERLGNADFARPEQVSEWLNTLFQRTVNRALSAEGRRRLERLMPLLLAEVIRHDSPETGLEDLLRLIDQISRRSAYLALLYERPATLERLVRVFRTSARLAEWIVASPQLLDDLLDPIHGFDLPGLPTIDGNDPEAGLHALGRWRQAGFLRTALAELDDRLTAHQAAEQLTSVAEAIIEQVLALVSENEPDLAVIGYGNLGAGLLHFESDLDLVFLHGDGPAPLRSAQRLISFMQMLLPGGRLFEIDTRLRPNGRSGLLVSRLDSFAEYQHNKAWTWEHQALIRARWVAGNPELKRGFEQTRADVLRRKRDPDQTCKDLADMRQRQKTDRRESAVKSRLTDLQFIAELGVLTEANQDPELLISRQPHEQFRRLAANGWINQADAERIIGAWHQLLSLRHRDWLVRDPDSIVSDDLNRTVERAWQSAFGHSSV